YEKIQPVLFRSFLLWVIILVIMLVIIGLVWQSGRTAQQTVEKLAFEDEVTGGRNLNYFRKKATEIINQNRETPFLIYRFDILNFRYINEAYGHGKADTVLKACVQEFNRIYSQNELCVRINSDHFLALVMNNMDSKQNFQNYSKAVGECARASGVRYPIRLRVGIYQVRKDDYDIDIMIDHANAARKSLNGLEKIQEAVYSEKIVSNMKKVDAIESQMQSAIINDEFKIYLQPKWDVVNDCLVGAEALVRWVKDDGSMVYPSDFIPIFETNGFIEKLDFHMLEMLCKRIRDIEEEGKYRIVPISVNQSRIMINNPDYVKNVEKVISRYNTKVEHLEIEITETVFFDEKSKMIEVVKQLKELGLNLAMDDFGSGYSSLNILRDIPFDILKIDREFVSESVASKSSIIIMEKIIEMAKGLNIRVICEGVETMEQVDVLRKLGCTMVQGYYYDRPIPMDEFLEKYCKNELSDRA
ncbi:MAG: GGDEF domain-containing protein, partial [Lachnospiraceae bacterium]|nr:GGDEF domain-containing protein [Lachnospiraceae bacterium]